jgi:hypothetical protein
MTYEATLATSRIIQRHDPEQLDVLSCRHEVVWPDGSRIGLHPVRQYGAAALYLRALHHAEHWLVFDLRRISPSLGTDLAQAPLRDQPGTVLYTLRAQVHNATQLIARAEAEALARWPGSPRAADPRPSRKGDAFVIQLVPGAEQVSA